MSNIIAIAAQPAQFKLELKEMQDFVFGMTEDDTAKRKFGYLLKDKSIQNKYAVIPDFTKNCTTPELYTSKTELPDTAARMKVFEKEAVQLGVKVATEAIEKSQLKKEEITHIITVSCTGLFAPGLEIEISQKLQLLPNIQRHAINFMGCYAAFHGMRLADLICRADANSNVLVVCVELCSLHFRKDSSEDNLLSTYLFSDGASACIVSNKIPQLNYLECFKFESKLIGGKKDMAWNIGNHGFEMVLKRDVPKHIEYNIAFAFLDLIEKFRLQPEQIQHYAIHPGGKNILKAFENSLRLDPSKLDISKSILFEYGNMSSATILFVLKAFLEESTSKNDQVSDWLYSAAFGPGLTVENALFKLHKTQ